MEYLQAFRVYKARPRSQYFMSAIAENGDIVVSLWQKLLQFDKLTHTVSIEEDISQWTAQAGKNEFIAHMRLAKAEGRPIRLICTLQKKDNDIAVHAQTGNAKSSEPFEHLVGEVDYITEDSYRLIFHKA